MTRAVLSVTAVEESGCLPDDRDNCESVVSRDVNGVNTLNLYGVVQR